MKKITVPSVAAIALMTLGAATAQAQVQSAEAGFVTPLAQVQTSLTRQQVTNAVLVARQNGTLITNRGDELRVSMARSMQVPSSLSRDEVKAGTIATLQHQTRLPGQNYSVQ